MRHNLIKTLIGLVAIEGLLAVVWLLALPSEPGSAFFLGQSRPHLALIGATLLATAVLAWAAFKAFAAPAWLERALSRLDGILLERGLLVPGVLFLALSALAGLACFLILVGMTPAYYAALDQLFGSRFSTIYSVATRAIPFWAWALAAVFQGLAALLVYYFEALKEKKRWSVSVILETLLAWLVSAAVLLHWTVLVSVSRLLRNIPGWYWKPNAKAFTPRDALFIALFAALMGAAYWVSRRPQHVWRNLILLFFLGFAVQAGMGVVEGQGIESLRQKFFSSYHNAYALFASNRDDSIGVTISRYEEIYGKLMFPGTKPPGVMVTYIALERTLNHFDPQPNNDARYARLTRFIAWTFPFVSMLAVFLIFFAMRKSIAPGQDPGRLTWPPSCISWRPTSCCSPSSWIRPSIRLYSWAEPCWWPSRSTGDLCGWLS